MQGTLINHHIIRYFLIRILSITLRLSSFAVRPNHIEEGLIGSIVIALALQRNAFQSADDGAVCLLRVALLVLFNLTQSVLCTTSFEFVCNERSD
jgi:hypothetical protein